MYIYILLDTVLATDVNKYSLAFASCQPIWRTLVGERNLFLAVAKDCGMSSSLNQSVFWLVSQSRRMSAIFVGSCRWTSLAAACADPVVESDNRYHTSSGNTQKLWNHFIQVTVKERKIPSQKYKMITVNSSSRSIGRRLTGQCYLKFW